MSPEGNIGTAGKYDIEFKDGSLEFDVSVNQEVTPGISVSGTLTAKVGAKGVLEAIKRAVPNAIVDELITLIEKIPGVQ